MKKRGFTIIELMVVISIIGILMAITLVGIRSAREKSKVSKAKGDVSAISLAANAMYSDTRRYPLCHNNLKPTGYSEDQSITADGVGIVNNTGCFSAISTWRGPYFSGTGLDPWGTNYQFGYLYTPKSALGYNQTAVVSWGPNKVSSSGQDDTCDDVYISLAKEAQAGYTGTVGDSCTGGFKGEVVE